MSLKEIPQNFSIDSEEDIKTLIISFFSELGFDRDEISCEDYFSIQLGHLAVDIDKKMVGGRSDILIARNGQPLAIVETKAITHKLVEADAKQAISYARLLLAIAPFAIVTNGVETRVYDVLASELTTIENSQNSVWFNNGKQISSLGDEIKYEAIKNLISLNPEILEQFCKRQISTGLIDFKSNIDQNKKYIPELYVERLSLNEAYKKWLLSNRTVFAVVSQSGFGKTNFMCVKVEEIATSHYALFYNASRFTNGLLHSIINDFIWEFHRDKTSVHIFDRLDEIAKNAGKKFFIFLDAIDEDPSGITAIKNELLNFVSRLQNYPNIRLIISCKLFDWPYLIIDSNQAFNNLAETIEPSCRQPKRRLISPNPDEVGFHLSEFTDKELLKAIKKYKKAYLLKGNFSGELLKESHNPLMLRFISEIFGGKEELPDSISSLDLFNLYWKRKSTAVMNLGIAENILTQIASLIFISGKRGVVKNKIISNLVWGDGYDRVLHLLFSLGILAKSYNGELEIIGFEFNKFLLYFYIFRVLNFQTLEPNEQVNSIKELAKSKIGIEAVDFYLSVENQETVHELLKNLAGKELLLFTQMITEFSSIKNYKKSTVPIEHITNYLDFYNFFRDKYFEKLSISTMPYENLPLGVIFGENMPFQFRACTPSYRQPLIQIEDDNLIRQLIEEPINKKIRAEIMPVGPIYIGGIHYFSEHPQGASYKHLIREIGKALSHKTLDETNNPEILKERVHDIIFYNPSIWLEEDDHPFERYWKLMGYKNEKDIEQAKMSDLIDRVNDLIGKYRSCLTKHDNLYRSFSQRLIQLLTVYYTLSLLHPDDYLGHLPYSIDRLWGYLNNSEEAIVEDVRDLLPHIIQNYRLLFSQNFPSIAQYSNIFSNLGKLKILELIKARNYSDFFALSYIFCPNAQEDTPTRIIFTKGNHSLVEKLKFKTLRGEGYSVSIDQGCGYTEIDTTIEDEHIIEQNAWVIKTRFPSRTPIIDQTYSLIFYDLEYMLRADHMDWRNDSSNLVNNEYLRLAIKYLEQKRNSTQIL